VEDGSWKKGRRMVMSEEKKVECQKFKVVVYKLDAMAEIVVETESPRDARRIALEQRKDLAFKTTDTPYMAFCDPTPITEDASGTEEGGGTEA
jgi:hypothetical protein